MQPGEERAKALRAPLRRWAEMVRRLALRRGGHSRLDPAAYRALQGELMEMCRQPDDPQSPLHQIREDVEELVGPWVSLESLAHVGRALLDDLLDRAERLQRQLAGRKPQNFGKRWRRLAIPAAAVVPITVLVAMRCDLCPQAAWLSQRLRDLQWIVVPPWLLAEMNRLQNCGPVEIVVVLGIAEAALLAPLLWLSKSWS